MGCRREEVSLVGHLEVSQNADGVTVRRFDLLKELDQGAIGACGTAPISAFSADAAPSCARRCSSSSARRAASRLRAISSNMMRSHSLCISLSVPESQL